MLQSVLIHFAHHSTPWIQTNSSFISFLYRHASWISGDLFAPRRLAGKRVDGNMRTSSVDDLIYWKKLNAPKLRAPRRKVLPLPSLKLHLGLPEGQLRLWMRSAMTTAVRLHKQIHKRRYLPTTTIMILQQLLHQFRKPIKGQTCNTLITHLFPLKTMIKLFRTQSPCRHHHPFTHAVMIILHTMPAHKRLTKCTVLSNHSTVMIWCILQAFSKKTISPMRICHQFYHWTKKTTLSIFKEQAISMSEWRSIQWR